MSRTTSFCEISNVIISYQNTTCSVLASARTFESSQYETLSCLCAAIAQHYQLHHIAGHEHVAPIRKQDPGAGFDWKYLQQSLGWTDASFPQKN